MTASKFYNLLGKLIVENKSGRSRVCIDKRTFEHALESKEQAK